MKKPRKKIAVLSGGPSPEHEVSLKTGRNVAANLDPEKYGVEEFVISKKGEWPVEPEDLKKRFDIAFIAMHGPYGEDGTVQGILDAAGVPYVGSGAMASALGMNKWLSLRLFQDAGLLIPPTIHLSRQEWFKDREGVAKKIRAYLAKPWILKPNASGSSFGVRVEKDDRDLNQALETSLRDSKEIIIQEFIPGRELTCGVIDGGVPNSTFVLPPTEIILAGSPFFDYKTKYAPATMEITPAPIPDSFTQAVKRAALIAHKAVGCCNFSRSDFILSGKDKGKLFILEINTIPGMTENSLIPRAAKAIGMSFPKLLETLVQGALLKK